MPTTQDVILQCREKYGPYYLGINPTYKYVRYQQEIIVPALEGLEAGKYDRLMVLMAPGESKTRLCTAGFAPWIIGRRPDREVLILSYGDLPASEFGQTVRDQLKAPIHKAIFPWCKINQGASARTYFQTSMGGKIYAVGWGGAIARIRADYVLIDDPLKNYEDATSDAAMETLMRTFESVVKDRLKPGGKILVCTNRWAPRDFVGRVLEKERARWKVITIQAEPPAHSEQAQYLSPGCQFLWEEYRGRQHYLDAKADQWKWETTQQQSPEKAEPQRFERQWLKFYTDRINPGRFQVWVLCDAALAESKKADRTSIMALAGGPGKQLFLVDWILDRLNPRERTNALLKMADRWEASAILYEETGMQADTFYLDEDAELFGLSCPIIPVGRRGKRHMFSKEQRIRQLTNAFREGQIVLPAVEEDEDANGKPRLRPYFIYKQKDGIRVNLMDYFIEQEYVPWSGKNSIAHDEGLDCLSRIYDPEFQMTYDETPQTEEGDEVAEARANGIGVFAGRVNEAGGGSWFSR